MRIGIGGGLRRLVGLPLCGLVGLGLGLLMCQLDRRRSALSLSRACWLRLDLGPHCGRGGRLLGVSLLGVGRHCSLGGGGCAL